MVTIEEAVERVQSLYSSGVESDDTRLSDELIFNKLMGTRNLLTIRKKNKKSSLSSSSYQKVLVELEEVPVGSEYCIPDLGCTQLASKEKLPGLLKTLFGELISVTTINGKKRFSKSTFNNIENLKYSKYSKNKDTYYIYDNRLFVQFGESTNKSLRWLLLDAVWDDVVKASNCITPQEETSGDACKAFYKKEFPIDSDLYESCINMTSQELVNTYLKVNEDRKNNAADR